ncbi:MAG: sulfite exporter TauE/SafE family protein [Steroidobacteraceae bacterium]|jgi:hypothetical protein|nr:sulfite exporter TauE/SafE family protein [Steroidobacteraceae bacterium]
MLAAILGSLVGIVLGLTGAGGSIFAVPLLVFGLGWTLPQATPVALLAVLAAATLGTATGWRSGLIARRAALLAGLLGSLSAPLGLALAARLPARMLVLAFAAAMLVVAARMLRQAGAAPDDARVVRAAADGAVDAGDPLCRIDPATQRLRWNRPCAFAVAVAGAVTGVLSGALGVGAGFVIVPTLRAVTGLSMQACVATSLMTIAIVSTAATAAHLVAAGPAALPLAVAAPFVGGALLGMLASRRVARRISGPVLQSLFAALMIAAAALLAWRELAPG